MKALASWVFICWLNSLWQVVLVFAVAWLAARAARRIGPRVEHRIWVAALLLEAVLPFCSFLLSDLLYRLTRFALALSLSAGASEGSVRVVVGDGVLRGTRLPHLPAALVLMVGVACLCSLVYFAGRLAWGFWKTRALLSEAAPLHASDAVWQRLGRYAERIGIPRQAVRLATSSAVNGPVTLGMWRWTLLFPPRLLETAAEADIDAVLAHELAHLKRHDFAKNLLYEVLSLPSAWHPLVWLTRAQIAGTREMVCDAMAAGMTTGQAGYSQSLLRLAALLVGRARTNPLPAIGIFDGDILERRIMNLKQKHETRVLYRIGIAALCGVAALATCSSALAFRVNADDSQQTTAPTKKPKRVMVSSGVMQGNLIEKSIPAYPEDAKKNKIEGTVVLGATISKAGAVENLRVVSGPEPLQQSSLDAVRQWRYKPYLLNGDPVEVETQINVVYSLGK